MGTIRAITSALVQQQWPPEQAYLITLFRFWAVGEAMLTNIISKHHMMQLLGNLTHGLVARVTSLFTAAYFTRIAVCFAIMAPTPILILTS